MKKSYFLSFFLLTITYSSLFAQNNSYIGFGTAFEFNKSITSLNGGNGLQPTDFSSNGYSINIFLHSNADKAFQFRLNTRLNPKTIQFDSDDLVSFGDLMMNTIEYSFVSVDLGLMGMYAFSLNENNKLFPTLGVFGSYNSYNGFMISRNDGTIMTAQELIEKTPINANRPNVTYLGLNAGLLYQAKINERLLEFYFMFYFQPTDGFEVTYDYENEDSMTYRGRHQTIALGINAPILLRKNRIWTEE